MTNGSQSRMKSNGTFVAFWVILCCMAAGFLNILKPPGMTSHDVVAVIRRRLPRGLKVGHLGTLDPAAAGVLPLAVGWATRLISHLPDPPKAYLAEVQFGVRSDSHDAEGVQTPGGPLPQRFEPLLRAQLEGFSGTILQVPPQVSALRQNGQRGYERARRGEAFELPARPATYHEIRYLGTQGERVRLRVACGPGTYIRALARDLGEALGCGAILSFLLRLQSGPFHLPEAHCLEELERPLEALLPWDWPLGNVARYRLEQWPPPAQGSDGLALHARGAALYRGGQRLWAREGVADGAAT